MEDDDLVFTSVREFSPQWEVSCRGIKVARVTERFIQEPPYMVCLLLEDGNEREVLCKDRDEVCEVILAAVR